MKVQQYQTNRVLRTVVIQRVPEWFTGGSLLTCLDAEAKALTQSNISLSLDCQAELKGQFTEKEVKVHSC